MQRNNKSLKYLNATKSRANEISLFTDDKSTEIDKTRFFAWLSCQVIIQGWGGTGGGVRRGESMVLQ